MTLHRLRFEWRTQPVTTGDFTFLPSALARATFITLLCFGAPLRAQPDDYSVASRITGQAEAPATHDPYAPSLRQDEPYDRGGGADPTWASGGGTVNLQALDAEQDPGGGLHRDPLIVRTMNYTVEPEKIVPPSRARAFARSRSQDFQGVNTIDPLALTAATVNARLPIFGAANNHGTSPFVAGNCLYHIQEPVQGLPSACR